MNHWPRLGMFFIYSLGSAMFLPHPGAWCFLIGSVIGFVITTNEMSDGGDK